MTTLKRPARRSASIPATHTLVWLASALALGAVALLHLWRHVSYGDLTRDPAASLDAPMYLGLLSNAGMVLWAAATGICLFAGGLCRLSRPGTRWPAFLLAFGALTGFLLMDDLYMFHDEIFPDHLGISQGLMYGAYLGLIAFLFVYFRGVIARTPYLLLLACAGFGVSVLADIASDSIGDFFLVEDGAKFVGIAYWLAYLTRCAAQALLEPGPGASVQPTA